MGSPGTVYPYSIRLIENPVAAAAQAAFEYSLFVAIGPQARLGTTQDRAGGRAISGIAMNGASGRTNSGAHGAAFRNALAYLDLLGVGLAFFPILRKFLRINALGVHNRVSMRRTSGQRGH